MGIARSFPKKTEGFIKQQQQKTLLTPHRMQWKIGKE